MGAGRFPRQMRLKQGVYLVVAPPPLQVQHVPRCSSPAADCVHQVLRHDLLRRLQSRAAARARSRQRALLRQLPLVLRFSRYWQRARTHAVACAAARVSATVLAVVPLAPLLSVTCNCCVSSVSSTRTSGGPPTMDERVYSFINGNILT